MLTYGLKEGMGCSLGARFHQLRTAKENRIHDLKFNTHIFFTFASTRLVEKRMIIDENDDKAIDDYDGYDEDDDNDGNDDEGEDNGHLELVISYHPLKCLVTFIDIINCNVYSPKSYGSGAIISLSALVSLVLSYRYDTHRDCKS